MVFFQTSTLHGIHEWLRWECPSMSVVTSLGHSATSITGDYTHSSPEEIERGDGASGVLQRATKVSGLERIPAKSRQERKRRRTCNLLLVCKSLRRKEKVGSGGGGRTRDLGVMNL